MGVVSRPWVSIPRSAMLYYAARGHICKLCTYYKNYTVIQAVRYPACCCFSTCDPRTGPQWRVWGLCHKKLRAPWASPLVPKVCFVDIKASAISSHGIREYISVNGHFESYAYWTVHHLDIWIKVDQLDDTCFIMSISSRKLLKMDVLTSEICWAVNWHNKASVI